MARSSKLLFLLLPLLLVLIPVAQAKATLVQKYDSEGFAVFSDKTQWYMHGYRDGVLQADEDINNSTHTAIDGNRPDIVCPANSNPEYCLGYKDGYSDEAMDQLE